MAEEQEQQAGEQPGAAEVKNPADHLKDYRWPKGRSGNPAGGTPGLKSMWRQLGDYLDERITAGYYPVVKQLFGIKPDEEIPDKLMRRIARMRVADLFVRSLTFDAITGHHLEARQMIFNRIDGRVPQVLEGPGGRPLIPASSYGNCLIVTVTGECPTGGAECPGCDDCP